MDAGDPGAVSVYILPNLASNRDRALLVYLFLDRWSSTQGDTAVHGEDNLFTKRYIAVVLVNNTKRKKKAK